MIVTHIIGIPLEETALQLTAAGGATITVIAIAGRTRLGRLLARIRRH